MQIILLLLLYLNNMHLLANHKSPTFLFFATFYIVIAIITALFDSKLLNGILIVVYTFMLGNTLGLHLFYYGNDIADYLLISIQLFIMIIFSIVEIVKEEPPVNPAVLLSLKIGD